MFLAQSVLQFCLCSCKLSTVCILVRHSQYYLLSRTTASTEHRCDDNARLVHLSLTEVAQSLGTERRPSSVLCSTEALSVCSCVNLVQIVTAWNGLAIGAFAVASQTLQKEDPPMGRSFPVEGSKPSVYLQAAIKARPLMQGCES